MSDRNERRGRNVPAPVTPNADRPELALFIAKLWANQEGPSKLEVRPAGGRHGKDYGEVVGEKIFKPNQATPTQEQCVAISNELLESAQLHCNAIGRSYRYSFQARNYSKSADVYQHMLLALEPTGVSFEKNDPENDDEELTSDPRRRDQLNTYVLDVLKEQNQIRQWEQDLAYKNIGAIMDRQNLLLDKAAARVESLEARQFDWMKAIEEMLSKKEEREMAREQHKFNLGIKQQAFQFVTQLIPVVVKQLGPKKDNSITAHSPESLACKTFLDGLTNAEGKLLFGDLNKETQVLVGNGILNTTQIEIFVGVAEARFSPDAIDDLFSGGAHEISPEQMLKVQETIPFDKLQPLMALVMERQMARGAQQPQHSQDQSTA